MSEMSKTAVGGLTPDKKLDSLEAREYQINIAKKCVNKNSLVVLPTGLGKTIIAVLVASKTIKIFPKKSKIIVLAPTRPLINQHFDTFSKFLNVSIDKFIVLTGKILPEKRVELFSENQIVFFTPQTLRNDLVNKRYSLINTALIIYDEAHHATGDYAYTMIADEYKEQNPDGVSLALTASPGASKKKIQILCENLHIPLANIHIRTRKDTDVKSYLQPMSIYKIGVNLTTLMAEVYAEITVVLEERLLYLTQLNFLSEKSRPLHNKIIRKDLLRLNKELVSLIQQGGDKTGVYSALSINAQGLILYHMIELVEQQGLDVLLIYLEKVKNDAKKAKSSKAVKILASDTRLQRIYIELKRNQEFTPENLVHPKYHVLLKVLQDQLTQNPESRILVFVKLRDSLKNIVNHLKKYEIIKPARFVGQATKSADDKGLSQKKQIEDLEQFKNGVFNVLVSTNVAEEGLDIAECNLVVFYDVVASEIRLIQRKGRTARKKEGKVIILFCKGTHDEVYLKIAMAKLRKMNVNLKNPRQLKESYDEEGKNNNAEDNPPQIHRQRQSKLGSYLTPDVVKKEKSPLAMVKISNRLPMKFGIRKRLQNDSYEYKIVDSDLHIILHNRVLIQIYTPRQAFLSEVQEFSEICELCIIIIDFIEFKEEFPGEKRKVKQRIQKIAHEKKIQIIPLENEEELYFIIKSILESFPKEDP
ncbi:hypothetical protein LCGC14_0796420 [marine sediment metagenome]|uniref:DEAD/DEAH box helicase n=1 Tax=marine sediment metagenome TaxID=412755 RepID=A0A0F9PQV9_9ZZZZ